MSVNDIMYILLKEYLYWGKGESHPFPTPSPAFPKSLFAWQNDGRHVVEQGGGGGGGGC